MPTAEGSDSRTVDRMLQQVRFIPERKITPQDEHHVSLIAISRALDADGECDIALASDYLEMLGLKEYESVEGDWAERKRRADRERERAKRARAQEAHHAAS